MLKTFRSRRNPTWGILLRSLKMIWGKFQTVPVVPIFERNEMTKKYIISFEGIQTKYNDQLTATVYFIKSESLFIPLLFDRHLGLWKKKRCEGHFWMFNLCFQYNLWSFRKKKNAFSGYIKLFCLNHFVLCLAAFSSRITFDEGELKSTLAKDDDDDDDDVSSEVLMVPKMTWHLVGILLPCTVDFFLVIQGQASKYFVVWSRLVNVRVLISGHNLSCWEAHLVNHLLQSGEHVSHLVTHTYDIIACTRTQGCLYLAMV